MVSAVEMRVKLLPEMVLVVVDLVVPAVVEVVTLLEVEVHWIIQARDWHKMNQNKFSLF